MKEKNMTRIGLACGALIALCVLAFGIPQVFAHGDHSSNNSSHRNPPNPYGSWGTPSLMVLNGSLEFEFPTASGAQDLGPALNGCAPPRPLAAPRTYVQWRMSSGSPYSLRNTSRCGEETTHSRLLDHGHTPDTYWFRAPSAWNPWHSPSFSILSVNGETWSSGNNRGFTINGTTGQIRTVSSRSYSGRYEIRLRVRAKRTTWTGAADANLPTSGSEIGQSSSTYSGYFRVITNTANATRPDAPETSGHPAGRVGSP